MEGYSWSPLWGLEPASIIASACGWPVVGLLHRRGELEIVQAESALGQSKSETERQLAEATSALADTRHQLETATAQAIDMAKAREQLADEVQMQKESTTVHARLAEWTTRKQQLRAERTANI